MGHHGQGRRMVRRSHTAMDSSTVLVGDLMELLLNTSKTYFYSWLIRIIHRPMMMRVLDTKVTSMRKGITQPYTGPTSSSGPSQVEAFTLEGG